MTLPRIPIGEAAQGDGAYEESAQLTTKKPRSRTFPWRELLIPDQPPARSFSSRTPRKQLRKFPFPRWGPGGTPASLRRIAGLVAAEKAPSSPRDGQLPRGLPRLRVEHSARADPRSDDEQAGRPKDTLPIDSKTLRAGNGSVSDGMMSTSASFRSIQGTARPQEMGATAMSFGGRTSITSASQRSDPQTCLSSARSSRAGTSNKQRQGKLSPLPATKRLAAESPPPDLCKPLGVEEVARILKEELVNCKEVGEIEKLRRVLTKVIHCNASDTFSTGGRVAFRLREAMRPLRESGLGAALGHAPRLKVQQVWKRESRLRKRQLTEGSGDSGESQSESSPSPRDCSISVKLLQRKRDNLSGDSSRGLASERASTQTGELTVPERRSSVTSSPLDSSQALAASATRRPSKRAIALKAARTTMEYHAAAANEAQARWGMLKESFKIGALRGQQALLMWFKVFDHLKDDGEVHHTDLKKALDMVGYEQPDTRCIEKARLRVTEYSTLSSDQFKDFVVAFGHEVTTMQETMFEEADTDDSGLIDRQELENLLTRLGIPVMRHILDEIMEEVDQDKSGQIDFQEFKKVCDVVRLREGFTRAEFENLMEMFKRIDIDNSGEMSAHELGFVCSYLDVQLESWERDDIIKLFDHDKTGALNDMEYLLCMRKFRQVEVKKLREVFDSADIDKDQHLDFYELMDAYRSLGYDPDVEACWEAAQMVGIEDRAKNIDFSEFFRVLAEYRSREGFVAAELQKIEQVFVEVAGSEDKEIGVAQINVALRKLGGDINFEQLQYLMCKVDLDGSGLLNHREFRKMLRYHQAQFGKVVQAVFEDSSSKGSGVLSTEEAWKAFQRLGLLSRSDNSFKKMADFGSLDHVGFQLATKELQKEAREFRRTHWGFGEEQVEELQVRFKYHDVDESGLIESFEMVQCIEEVIPGLANKPENRPRLQSMISQVTRDRGSELERRHSTAPTPTDDLTCDSPVMRRQTSGASSGFRRKNSGDRGGRRMSTYGATLNFDQFLHLMALAREFKLEHKYEHEMKIIEESDLTLQEVQQFRELFLESVSGDGVITHKDLRRMLKNVCPLGDRNTAELNGHIESVLGPERVFDDMEFAEMLQVMQRLLDTNFGGLRDRVRE